jgi:uroporphyrinogen III methyltransferase/synthase
MNGKVFLVGAGPGDPALITIKGKECIEKADVIIYDYLASPELLKFAGKNAEKIFVGKQSGCHTVTQEKINELIVKKAQTGLIVTRLKGGDPFIFGRGGEEAEALIDANIAYEIVPGVTSAIAAPAYAGIPLTHRKFTSTLAFVTGHEDPEKNESGIDWESLAKGIGTIVFLMGVKNLHKIVEKLVKYGRKADTPVAIIRWGSTPIQFTISGTLENIVEKAKTSGIKPPAVIVVGQVVTFREKMKWFENRPLMGKHILVTRSREQSGELVKLLSGLGAACLECPLIKVVPIEENPPLDQCIEILSSYDWIIFTSVNGVDFFFEALFSKQGKDVRSLNHLKTAAIGPATQKRMFDFGVKSDMVPKTYTAESIAEAFLGENIKGKKILLPRAKQARAVIPEELTNMGACVDDVAVYCTEPDEENADLLLSRLRDKRVDMVTFTSSSTVKNFYSIIHVHDIDLLMNGVVVACIGPVTAETAIKLGFNVDIISEESTIHGLCDAIVTYYNM